MTLQSNISEKQLPKFRDWTSTYNWNKRCRAQLVIYAHPDVNIISKSCEDDCSWLSLEINRKIANIAFIYFSPKKQNGSTYLQELIETHEVDLILGDFNVRSQTWDSKAGKKQNEIEPILKGY